MPVLRAPSGPTHSVGEVLVTSLATPARGSAETSVWQVDVPPGAVGTPHSVTREEVLVVVTGAVVVELDGQELEVSAGDSVVVPVGSRFALSGSGRRDEDGGQVARLLCALPVGGQARVGDGLPFTPPWAL